METYKRKTIQKGWRECHTEKREFTAGTYWR